MNNFIRSIIVSINLEKLTQLVGYNAQLIQEKADLRQQLATALASDVADAQAISDAQAKATEAQAEAQTAKEAIAPLQSAIDADTSEDAKVKVLLDSVVIPVDPMAPVVPVEVVAPVVPVAPISPV